MTQFTAHAAAFVRDEDLEAEVLVVAENEDGSGRRLEVSRALEITDEDRELGMDTYAISNELGATHYGGLASWSVDGDAVTVELSEDAAGVLGADGGYRIELSGTQAPPAVVEEALTRLVT